VIEMAENPTCEELKQRISELEQQNELLQSEAAKYRTLFDSFPHGITVSDSHGNVAEANSISEQLLGIGKEEHQKRDIAGQEWRIVREDGTDMPPEEWASVIALKKNRMVADCEMGIVKPDGQTTWLNVTAAPLRIEGYGVVVTYNDITKNIQAEADLKQSEKKYRILYEGAGIGIFHSTFEGQFLDVNPCLAKMLGYETPEEVLDSIYSIAEQIYAEPQDRDEVLDQLLAEGETIKVENRYLRKDGTEWDAYLHLRHVFDSNGQSICLEGFVEDITERKQIEKALKESEERYRSLFENVNDAVYLHQVLANGDPGKFEEVNPAACKMLGYNEKEFRQMSPWELDDPEASKHLIPWVMDSLREYGKAEFEAVQVARDGGKVDVDVNTVMVPVQGKEYIVSVCRDITERKRIEKELRLHESIVSSALEPMAVIDKEYRYLFVNSSYATFWDIRPKEIMGKHVSEILGNDVFEKYVKPMVDKCLAGENVTYTSWFQSPVLGKRFISLNYCPHYNNNGDVIGLINISYDITEQKRAEEKIKDREERYRTLFVRNPNPIAIINMEGNYLDANESFLNFVETSKESLLEMSVFDFASPGKIASQKVNHKPTWVKGGTLVTEYVINGTIKLLELNITPVTYDGIEAVIGVGKDITEQRRAEEAVKESEEKYRSMMESMSEATYICSSDFLVEYMNPAMVKKLGRDATGEKCHMALYGIEEQCPWCQHEKIMKGEFVKTEIEKPGGDEVYFVSHSPIFHTDGTISKLSIYRDITDVKKLEQRVQQAQKMEAIGNLAGGIAHDFNNLLFPIVGMSEMLMADLPKGSPEHENVQIIYNSGIRGKDLVKQILAFGRQSDQNLIPVQVQRILKEVFKLVRTTIPANIEIIQEVQKDCGMVMADPTQLHQVVMNLVTNAFHAVEKSGETISVKLKETVLQEDDIVPLDLEPGSYAQVTVSDKGYGIDPSSMSKIFDPYFTTKEKEKGTGLGLSVVHGIIKKYKGDITVDSELGKGTDFNIYLPIVEQTIKDRSHELSETLPKGREHILLVDDEKLIVQTEKQILEKLGYRVTFRSSSPEALEAFKANPGNFDLVITDMSMPQMTGEELSREVMEINPDIPVIICTGFSEMFNEKKAEAIGIKAFLMKPLVAEDLAQTVRNVLDEAKV
jgi:PAS domain S-box-containing protein